MKPITFSVVIPLYNKEAYILRAIDSVLAQTHGHFELIIVDDGSTDRSYAKSCLRTDARIKRIRQINSGEGAARNRGISHAANDYVAFLDADDAWSPEFLSAMVALIQAFPYQRLYASGYRIVDRACETIVGSLRRSPRIVTNYFKQAYSSQLPISASSVAVERHTLVALGGFNVDEPLGADQDLWCRLLFDRSYAIDPRPLATYHRESEGRICSSMVPSAVLPFAVRLRARLSDGGGSAQTRRYAQKYLAAHTLYLARLNIETDQLDRAAVLLDEPVTHHLMVKKCLQYSRLFLARTVRRLKQHTEIHPSSRLGLE